MQLTFAIQERSEVPVYHQIGRQIKAFLHKNSVPPGTMLPNVRKIAALANVSLRTADLALAELVKDGVCMRRPKKGTFVADMRRAAKRRSICLVPMPRGQETIATSIVDAAIHKGMLAKAYSIGIDVLITASEGVEEAVTTYASSAELSLRGVILTKGCDVDVVRRMAGGHSGMRFVYANYRPKEFEATGDNVKGVFNDEFGGAYQMASLLLKEGHRQFAALSWDVDDENYQTRIKGFIAALAEKGVDLPSSMIFRRGGRTVADQGAFGRETILKLLAKRGHPTGILCVNDLVAQGVCEGIDELGLMDKIGVTGFDNIMPALRGKHRFPTAAIDFEAIGAKALEIISNSGFEYPKEMRIQPEVLN